MINSNPLTYKIGRYNISPNSSVSLGPEYNSRSGGYPWSPWVEGSKSPSEYRFSDTQRKSFGSDGYQYSDLYKKGDLDADTAFSSRMKKSALSYLPKDAVRLTGDSPTFAAKIGDKWSAAKLTDNGGWMQSIMPTGWNPFERELPWKQKDSIGSDAQRQGAYLTGVNQNIPKIDYVGKYQARKYNLPFRPNNGDRPSLLHLGDQYRMA